MASSRRVADGGVDGGGWGAPNLDPEAPHVRVHRNDDVLLILVGHPLELQLAAAAGTPLGQRDMDLLIDTSIEVLLERYGQYLAVEHGLMSRTVEGYVHAVRPFLVGIGEDGGGEPEVGGLSAAQVTAFVVARCPAQSPGAAKMTVTALRSLLAFLHVDRVIARSLAGRRGAVGGDVAAVGPAARAGARARPRAA
jgi:hypothetical protein